MKRLTRLAADMFRPRTGLEIHIPTAEDYSAHILRVPEQSATPLLQAGALWATALAQGDPVLNVFAKPHLTAQDAAALVINGRNRAEGWSTTPRNMLDLRKDVLRGLSFASHNALTQQDRLTPDDRRVLTNFCHVVRPYTARRTQNQPTVTIVGQSFDH